MSSLADTPVRRIVTKAESIRDPADLLVLADSSPAPDGARVYRVLAPGDMSMLMASLYGTVLSGLDLALTDMDLSGLPDATLRETMDAIQALSQQWGNSTLDGVHGIVNLVHNARLLLPAPRVRKPITDMPIIAVGGGPSTQALLDDIRRSGCAVVCCDAALGPLLNAGIKPIACTPLERLRSTAQKLPADVGNVRYAGTLWTPPGTVDRFEKRTLWASADPVMEWLGITDGDFKPGTTTGTAAVAVALKLTSGPVYLVGHDLCGGHMPGADVSARYSDAFDAERLGNDGQMKQTKTAWLRAKYDLEVMTDGRVFNAGGHAGHGLAFDHIPNRSLPIWVDGGVRWPMLAEPHDLSAFEDRVAHLADDLNAVAAAAATAESLSDVGLERLCEPRNLDAIAYILRPLYAQCSIEYRLGREVATVLRVFRDGIANIAQAMEGSLRGCV